MQEHTRSAAFPNTLPSFATERNPFIPRTQHAFDHHTLQRFRTQFKECLTFFLSLLLFFFVPTSAYGTSSIPIDQRVTSFLSHIFFFLFFFTMFVILLADANDKKQQHLIQREEKKPCRRQIAQIASAKVSLFKTVRHFVCPGWDVTTG